MKVILFLPLVNHICTEKADRKACRQMNRRKMKKLLMLFLLFCSLNLTAQEKVEVEAQDYRNTEIEMADTMRSNGKIYIVVAVLVVIFAGLVGYAIRIDRKLGRLEKEVSSQKRESKTVV